MSPRVDFQKVLAEVDLVLLIASYGYQLVEKKSRPHKGEYFLKKEGQEHLIVYKNHSSRNNPQVYVTLNNTDDRGNAFNFLFNKGHVTPNNYKAAIETISRFDPSSVNLALDTSQRKPLKKKPFVPLPQEEISARNYLLKEHIPLEIISDPLFRGRIFTDGRLFRGIENVVYPAYKGDKLVSQLVRNKKFYSLPEGADKSSFWHTNLTPQTNCFFLFEDPKDALAHYALNKQNLREKKLFPCYMATFGSASMDQLHAVCTFYKNHNPRAHLVLAGDNDRAGDQFNLNALTKAVEQLKGYIKPRVSLNTNEKQLKISFTQLPYKLKHLISKEPGFNLSFDDKMNQYHLNTKLDNLGKTSRLIRDAYELRTVRFIRSKHKDFHEDLMKSLSLPSRKIGPKRSPG